MKKIFILLFLSVIIPIITYAQEPGQKTISFTESFSNFPNPERGFYEYTVLNSLSDGDVSWLRDEGITLIYGRVWANSNMNTEYLPGSFLNDIQNGFNLARQYGLKVNFRFVYHKVYPCDKCPDAPKSYISNHIEQLKPIWKSNADVLNLVEAGFIGPWGEWHSSELANTHDKHDILYKILESVPTNIMLVIRYSPDKRAIFTNSLAPNGYETVDAFSAFSGSPVARVGFHNDCFVSGPEDVGSYPSGQRQNEIDYIGKETRYTPWGGETCSSNHPPESYCDNAISEMERLHSTYLDQDYNTTILSDWKTWGCYDEIQRRFGYRFVLKNITISTEVKPGGYLSLQINLSNAGFASPFHKRPIELKLISSSTQYTIPILTDPRFWLPNQIISLNKQFHISSLIQTNIYKVALNFPDVSTNLYSDPRYSIHLANLNVWDATNGYNIIMTNLHIWSNALGTSTNTTNFSDETGFILGTTNNLNQSIIEILEPNGENDVAYGSFDIYFKINSYNTSQKIHLYYSKKSINNPLHLLMSANLNGGYHKYTWNTSNLYNENYFIHAVLETNSKFITNTSPYSITVAQSNSGDYIAYPNPLNPSENKLNIFYRAKADAEIEFYVYTIMGDFVKKIIANSDGSYSWDGTNDYNQSVAQGLYFLKMKINNKFLKKYIKIAITR